MSGDLRRELARTLNRHSAENKSNTPDFILAQFLIEAIRAFDAAVTARDQWYLGEGKMHGIALDSNVVPVSNSQCGTWNDDRTERCYYRAGHDDPHSWEPRPEDMIE